MEWSHASRRFKFLASAFDGSGGFCPVAETRQTIVDPGEGKPSVTLTTYYCAGPSELVRHTRESDAKFGARNAVAYYENHLKTACKRFVGFLGRRRPQREGIEAPLVKAMVENADMRGTDLDGFWRSFAQQGKARGSMLLVIDMPEEKATSLADQVAKRKVPYIRAARPETVTEFEIDDASGLFNWVKLADKMTIDGKVEQVEREYTQTEWFIRKGDEIVKQGAHAFGQCPVLAFTEDGEQFPVVGEYAQIADLSRRIFNARSERDDILRSQTFSILHMHVPADQAANMDAAKASVTIGTHSMLVHSGEVPPGFIQPDSGPATTYHESIEALQAAVRRITMEDALTDMGANESGEARRLRFEQLNADLTTFAFNLQALERRMWVMFNRALGTSTKVEITWPTDYNLADVMAELDVLTAMQTTGFPLVALNQKRKDIAATEFDNATDEVKTSIEQAIDEIVQEPDPAADPKADPSNPPQ